MLINFQTAKLSELSTMTGIPEESWCRWFSGKYSISGKSLEKAAKALNVSTPTLLAQIEQRKTTKAERRQTFLSQNT
jgi:transcriptional regulator with XRE-family HTH domain